MQLPLRTQSSPETYVEGHEWRDALLPTCPMHPSGGCSFARHGSYARVTPQGMRVARWYCPEGHCTFSLLPDFLAARLPGLLCSIEAAVAEAQSARSMEAAVDTLRSFEVTLPSALRWLRRRIRAVQAGLDTLAQLALPSPAIAVTSGTPGQLDSSRPHPLLDLRQVLSAPSLQRLPAPLGFLPFGGAIRGHVRDQHDMGPDGGGGVVYAATSTERPSPCNLNPLFSCRQWSFRRSRTCSTSGKATAA